jgi:hypothetical protein
MLNDRVHKQTAITGQERPIFASHQIEQLPVVSVLVIGDIKAEKAEITSESS